jgi:CBS domain-containing protein
MRVSDVMRKKQGAVVTVGRDEPVSAAARLLMEHNVGGLPVLDGSERVCGFVSERDIVRAVHERAERAGQERVDQVMRKPAPTCETDTLLQQAMSRMTRERLRHLIVLDGGRVAGVLSVGDLVKHRLEQLETETGVLRDYVTAQRARS